jgi:hypothetical protein
MAAFVVWGVIVFIGDHGQELAVCPAGGEGRPDLAAVDALARVQLAVRRRGGRIQLRQMCVELDELLDLVGLGREVGGQPEGREEVLGVEEGVESGDSVA